MTQQDFSLPPGTHTVAIGAGDPNGIMRGKRIPSSHWETICKDGNALSIALLAIDMTSDVWDTPYVSFDNGYPDMHMFPLTKPVASPWEEGVAVCMGRFEGMDHKPVPIDPRGALVDQVERAAAMGYEVLTGTELEFYLLDPETLKPRDSGIQVYSMARAAEMEHVLGPIRRMLNEMGIPIEQSNPEYAAGQVEVNIRYGEALESADKVVMFRSLIKELAHSHGYLATFMAKPFIAESGSGFHAHYSMLKDGRNAFAKDGKLSETGMHFMGGLKKHMCDIALAGTATPNGYKRKQPFSFSPVNNCWGYDNRTVGLRVIEGADKAVRVEKRDASADCNPYYLLACDIAAGLDGIEQEIDPGEPCLGNAYEVEDAEMLPTDMGDALARAKASELMNRVLGEERMGILTQQGERELEFMANQVTQVEMDRYIRNF